MVENAMEKNRGGLESRGPGVGTAIVKKMFREVLRGKITPVESPNT